MEFNLDNWPEEPWDHTQPFPESMKRKDPVSNAMFERLWAMGYEGFWKDQRNARIKVLQYWAEEHDIGFAKAPDLYARFQELEAMERDAEASFLAAQKSGNLLPVE